MSTLAAARPMPVDRVRQTLVIAGTVVALVGAFIGSGAAGGTPIPEVAGGALSADATLLAPAGPAFAIWSVIYAGLVAYAIWQALPSQAARERQRRAGFWVLASLLLNAAWILSVQAGQLGVSVAAIVALLAVLIVTFVILRRHPAESTADAVLFDGVIGLYLGWVMIATVANATSWLQTLGFDGFGASPARLGDGDARPLHRDRLRAGRVGPRPFRPVDRLGVGSRLDRRLAADRLATVRAGRHHRLRGRRPHTARDARGARRSRLFSASALVLGSRGPQRAASTSRRYSAFPRIAAW
ncbi:TspO/MBR family protein [Leifsonia sp. L25]|uniref:TspO/MBR family protein n=1 Tax=Leifsonia sp. L25 TaxID=3423957 RepID=UPI003D68FE19